MNNFSDTPTARFLYSLFRRLLLYALFFGLGFPAISQILFTTDSYKSNLTPPDVVGNWNDLGSWLRWDGAQWVVPSEIPNQNHDVFIQEGNEITLTQNEEVGNLYLFGAAGAGPKLNLQDYELDVFGALRSFEVVDDDFVLYGLTSATSDWIYPETGTIVFRGESRTVVDRASWSANNLNSRFKVVFDPDPGAELVVNAGFKASDFLIRSGTVRQTVSTNASGTDELTSTFSFNTSDDVGTGNYGNFRIASGATLISEAHWPYGQIIRRSDSKPASSFILEEGASLVLLGEEPVLDAAVVQLNGEVRYASVEEKQYFLAARMEQSESNFIYADIVVEGAAAKFLPEDLSVAGDFIYLSGGKVTALNEGGSTYTTISFIGDKDQVFDVPEFRLPGVFIDKPDGTLFLENHLEVTRAFSQLRGFINFQGNGFTLDFNETGSYYYNEGAWANLEFFQYNGLPLGFNGLLTSFPFFDTQFGVQRTLRLSGDIVSSNQTIRIVFNENPGVNDDPGFADTDGTQVVYHLNSFFEITTEGGDPNTIEVWILSDDLSIDSKDDLRLVGDGKAAIGEHLTAVEFGSKPSLWTGRAFAFNEAATPSLFTIGSTSSLSVLPIEWFSFESTIMESGVLLSWTTSYEEGLTYVVSRAEDNHLELRAIGTVDGEQGLGSYSFLDRDIPQHLKYGFYQVTAIMEEVPVSYSDLIRVDFPQQPLEGPIIFPNPYTGGHLGLHLRQYAAFSKVEVQVLNSQGISMLGTTIEKVGSNDYLLRKLSELEPGYYLINFFGEGKISTFKWIKLSQ